MVDTKDGGEHSERKSCLKRVEIYSNIHQMKDEIKHATIQLFFGES